MKDEFVSRVGIWGQRHYDYLKKNKPTVINVMRMDGTLKSHLTQVDRDAQEMYEKLIKEYTAALTTARASMRWTNVGRVATRRANARNTTFTTTQFSTARLVINPAAMGKTALAFSS